MAPSECQFGNLFAIVDKIVFNYPVISIYNPKKVQLYIYMFGIKRPSHMLHLIFS